MLHLKKSIDIITDICMRELVFVLQRYLAIVVSKVVVGEHYFVQPRLTCGYEIKVWCICIASVVQKFIRTTTVVVLCVIAEFYIAFEETDTQ